MAIKSISEFFGFSLFIFDLDNTIYNEEDYLLQAYKEIADRFAGLFPSLDSNKLFIKMKEIYDRQGREKLFDKFLVAFGIDGSYLPECLKILRTFNPERPLVIYEYSKHILKELQKREKEIFVLTNGNAEQQKNKISQISWDGLDKKINFVFAAEFEPKPSPAGVLYILKSAGTEKGRTIFIGDSDTDKNCAINSGVIYLDIKDLYILAGYKKEA
jgi:HAD superfamily hydrolase (TIGR01549 family)